MRTRPADITDQALGAHLALVWNLGSVEVEYAPVGGGSHHWQARSGEGRRYWANVDDLDRKPFLAASRSRTFAALQRALATAAVLGASGLEFVVAPLATSQGPVLSRFSGRYAVAVYPFVEGTTRDFDASLPPDEHEQLRELLARLHAATPLVRDLAPPWRPRIAWREKLEDALTQNAATWTAGPWSEDAHVLIECHAALIREALGRFDRLVRVVAQTTAESDLVVTHGEPHPGNLLSADGQLRLIDWDTVALAPPERDLWLAHCFTGEVDNAASEMYGLRWKLLDLALFVQALRAPHTDTADARHALHALEVTVAALARATR